MRFQWVDWLLVIISLVGTFVAGLVVHRRVRNLSDYLVAGRGVGLHLGVVSLFSTEMGIVTYMYFAELGYLAGYQSFLAALIAGAVLIFLGKTGFVIKSLRELNIMTVSEYFEIRYSRGVRVLAGVLMAVGGALNLGVFPRVEASFLNLITGIPESQLVWTMAVLLVMALIYTALGGMFSVVVTNYLHYLLLSFGSVLVTLVIFSEIGVWTVFKSVQQKLGEPGWNPFSNPEFGPAFILWLILINIALLISWQPVAARNFAARDAAVGKRIFAYAGVLFFSRGVLPMFWGMAALTYFSGDGAALSAMPLMLSELVPSGLMGLVVAGMLAASMSTYSSYLLSWSSVISQDVIGPVWGKRLDEKSQIRINRVTIVLLALFVLGWGIFYKIPGPTYFYLVITANLFAAGSLVAIVAGLYWRKASKSGAYLAFLAGTLVSVMFFFLDFPTPVLGFLSFVAALTAMLVASWVERRWRATRQIEDLSSSNRSAEGDQ